MGSDLRQRIAQVLQLGERSRSPLAIAGLVMLGLYAVFSKLLERVEFTKLTDTGSILILRTILQDVFVIALVTIVLAIVAYILPKVIPREWLVKPPRLEYGVAVFKMFDPGQTPMGQLMQSVEPFPGFPYFSRESDHPSEWPPRVWADRSKLWEKYLSFYQDPEVRKRLAAAKDFDPKAAQWVRSGPPDPEQEIKGYISSARSYLYEQAKNGGVEGLTAILGEEKTERFIEVEKQRGEIQAYFPNRLAIVRLQNSGTRDIVNLGVELEVAGGVYDRVIDADPEKVRNFGWEGDAQRVTFERLPRGYTAQIRLWYSYQGVSERAFPDKINFIQELTQGVKIANIAATQTAVSYSPEILEDLKGYERLYLGDARKKDSYEKELEVLFAKRAKEFAEHMKEYDKQHPTLKNLTVEQLGKVNVDDKHVYTIWMTFRSPGNRAYEAVYVFTHPKGPYVSLASKDRDKADMKLLSAKFAELYEGEAEAEISDRSGEICVSVNVAQGFTQAKIAAVAAELAAEGYTEFAIPEFHINLEQKGAAG